MQRQNSLSKSQVEPADGGQGTRSNARIDNIPSHLAPPEGQDTTVEWV